MFRLLPSIWPSLRSSNAVRIWLRDFHGSSMHFKRRTGSSALEPLPRPFSKKQIKRKQMLNLKRAEKYNPKTSKLKERHLDRQIESGKVESLLEKTTSEMFEAVREAMLPDGYPDAQNIEKKQAVEYDPDKALSYLESLKKAKKANRKPEVATSQQLLPHKEEPHPVAINRALVAYAKQNQLDKAMSMKELMKESNIQLNEFSYTGLIASATRLEKYDLADKLFDEMMHSGIEPNVYTWTAIINNKARSGRPEEAVRLIDQLIKIGVKVTSPMFNCVLKAYIDSRRCNEANEIWLRMHDEGVQFTVEDFSLMMKWCTLTRSAERALFYIDEMRSMDLQPDTYVFAGLFRACAEAPHWVKGYEDFITDAMCVMEGCEIAPTSEIYNNIIHAFAKAGNPVAAEFYFWEMRRKGLEQTTLTYNNLLCAFAWSQSVGAERYGRRGTFVRGPLYRKPTKDQEDLMIVPPAKVGGLSKCSNLIQLLCSRCGSCSAVPWRGGSREHTRAAENR